MAHFPTEPAPSIPRRVLVYWVAAFCLIGAGLGAAVWHEGPGAQRPVSERRPGMDRAAGAVSVVEGSPFERTTFTPGDGLPAALAGAWPCFRGPERDGICRRPGPIARDWPPSGPPALWDVALGEGYAGPIIRDGRVYLLDYDSTAQADVMRCLSLDDGREIWNFAYPIKVKRNHGMSRTVPALAGDYVVSFGPKCHVVCLNAETGAFVWGIDLVRDHGVKVPLWYAGQCPLIADGKVILGVGGNELMMAVDLASGEIVWRTPNPRGWKQTHVSVLPHRFAERDTYVYCGHGGVVGVDAKTGALLWETDAWKISIATCATPVPIGADRLFFSGGYNAGAMLMQLKEVDGRIQAHVLKRLEAAVFGSTQQTPILFEGHLYGVRPDGQLACLDTDANVVWSSGSGARFGIGPYLIVNGMILLLDDDGVLTLADASANGYRQLAQADVLDGHDAWAPLAVANGRLLARDLTRMVCLDLTGAPR